MLDTEFQTLSDQFPRGFKREFDAHIYYDATTREQAKVLRERAILEFRNLPVFITELIDTPIGPHPTPTFELCFSKALFSEIFLWILHSRGNLSVLVHEVTGNDVQDHSIGAVWLGDQVSLDESAFD